MSLATDLHQSAPDFRPERLEPGLELDLLRTFVTIAETGSFARAADIVLRTPSAVSMQMRRLEEAVGRELFAKAGRSVTLTSDGETLLGYARRLLRLAEETMAHFRLPAMEGSVTIGSPDDYVARFLPEALARFARTHPLVEVSVVCAPSAVLRDMLRRQEVDLALVSAGYGPSEDAGVVYRDRLVWVGARGGSAHWRRPLPLALSDQTCPWRRLACTRLDEAGISYRIAYSSQHYQGQIAAVLADLAIAPLPESAMPAQLGRIDADGLPDIGHYEILLCRAPRSKGPAVEALFDHLQASFRAF